jgi:hypothetical protein
MANGDAAAAAGLATFSQTQDHAQGYDNDNIRGDELADHIVNGGHPWGKITAKPALYTQAQIDAKFDDVDDEITAARSYAASQASTAQTNAINTADNLDDQVRADITGPGSNAHADGVSADAFGRTAASSSRVPMYMDAALNIGKNTSSRRYKEHITDAALDAETVLGLRPVTFTRRGDAEQFVELGLIAEEVADLGLEHLVVRDTEGRPDGVRYDILAVALLDVIGDLHRRLLTLEQPAPDPTPEV